MRLHKMQFVSIFMIALSGCQPMAVTKLYDGSYSGEISTILIDTPNSATVVESCDNLISLKGNNADLFHIVEAIPEKKLTIAATWKNGPWECKHMFMEFTPERKKNYIITPYVDRLECKANIQEVELSPGFPQNAKGFTSAREHLIKVSDAKPLPLYGLKYNKCVKK